MTLLKLAAPGSTVRVVTTGMDVLIEDVNIAGTALMVKYFVVWWNDRERKGVWLSAVELDIPESVVHAEVSTLEGGD